MTTITRKVVEDYYREDWNEVFSRDTLDLLVELTCRSLKLNQPHTPGFINEKQIRPNNLGQI